METALQSDLAREEATVQQVLDSPLQGYGPHLSFPSRNGPDPENERATSSKRSSRGGMVTTSQVRLKPKSPRRPSPNATASVESVFGKREAFAEGQNVVELQPMDKGFGAWSYVAATFAMYIVVWGFPYSFPIFQTYLSAGPSALYPDSVAIRLLAPGIQDIEEGLLFPMLPAASRHRRTLVIVGIAIITGSLVLASYANADWQIVLSQGVTFGVGGILMNFVHVSIFSEWFDKEKGKAMGIIWSGWRVGALAFPLICQWLLEEHGFAKTLRVLLPPMLTLLTPAVVLLRGRYHAATIAARPPQPAVSKLEAMRAPTVLYYLVATTLFFLVINVPNMFITTFAADLGLSGRTQAWTLVLLVLSEMSGTYLFGWLSDRHHHGRLMGSLAISSSLAHVLGLGLAKSKAGVFLYAIIIGSASGGFSNCLFTFYSDAAKGNGDLFTAIHSLFSFFRGISILSVGPVGAELLRHAPKADLGAFAIARYQYLLAYASALSFTSGTLIFLKAFWGKLQLRTQQSQAPE